MRQSFITFTAAFAILSLGSLVSDRAQAGGGATSAPSKYTNNHMANANHSADFRITEFSSSSAKGSVPKR